MTMKTEATATSSDLVKRLHIAANNCPTKDDAIMREAADRIEALERELANWREDFRALEKAVVGDTGMSAMLVATQAKLFKPRAELAEAQLAAEKALADRLCEAARAYYRREEVSVRDLKLVLAIEEYRKARGL